MARKNLSTETMIGLSAAWLDPKQERPLLEAHALTAGLLPLIEEAHRNAVASLKPAQTLDAELDDLQEQSGSVDKTHDRKARGIWYYYTAVAELSDNPDTVTRALDERDRLLPGGLSTTTMSYSDESGNAHAVKETLDPTFRKSLRSWKTIEGRTVEDEVDRWVGAGIELGRIEARRATLSQTGDEPTQSPPVPTQGRARNAWINITNGLVANVPLTGMNTAASARVLGPMFAAEAKADRRAARKAGEPEGEATLPLEEALAAAAGGEPAKPEK